MSAANQYREQLNQWKHQAHNAISQWLNDSDFRKQIMRDVMVNTDLGPFTKFLYHFACKCECGWGVMIDFNERQQRVFLCDHYYKWMHELRDAIKAQKEAELKDQLSLFDAASLI